MRGNVHHLQQQPVTPTLVEIWYTVLSMNGADSESLGDTVTSIHLTNQHSVHRSLWYSGAVCRGKNRRPGLQEQLEVPKYLSAISPAWTSP